MNFESERKPRRGLSAWQVFCVGAIERRVGLPRVRSAYLSDLVYGLFLGEAAPSINQDDSKVTQDRHQWQGEEDVLREPEEPARQPPNREGRGEAKSGPTQNLEAATSH